MRGCDEGVCGGKIIWVSEEVGYKEGKACKGH